METLLQGSRHDGWVAWFCGRVVRVRSDGVAVGVPICGSAIGAVGDTIGAAVHRAVGVGCDTVGRGVAVGMGVSVSVDFTHAIGMDLAVGAVGADAALDAVQGRGHAGWLVIWWEEVVVDVFDEDSLALHTGKYFVPAGFIDV